MVAIKLDGTARSLDLPPDCLSVADAASYAKQQLGAAWAEACPGPDGQRIARFNTSLYGLVGLRDIGRTGPEKKRLFLSAKGWQPGSTVTIDLPNGRTVVLPVAEATRAGHVAAFIAPLLGCAPTAVRLWRHHTMLVSLADQAAPGHHYRAKLVPVAGPGTIIEVFIKTLSGKTVAAHCASDSRIEHMKRAIADMEGIPVDQQRLIFKGIVLDDHHTLQDYSIGAGDTVHLVLRLRGGMFAASSGRAGDFEELGLAADERQVAAIAAADRTPLEVVLPDGSSVLLGCKESDGPREVMAALREHLAAAAADAAVLSADADQLEDVAAMRELLRQAQAAVRRRQL